MLNPFVLFSKTAFDLIFHCTVSSKGYRWSALKTSYNMHVFRRSRLNILQTEQNYSRGLPDSPTQRRIRDVSVTSNITTSCFVLRHKKSLNVGFRYFGRLFRRLAIRIRRHVHVKRTSCLRTSSLSRERQK